MALILGVCGCVAKSDDAAVVIRAPRGPRVRTLFVPWREYHPLSPDGVLILKEGRFTERIPLKRMELEIVNSGNAEVQDNVLILARKDMAVDAKGNSELGVSIEHAEREHLEQVNRFRVEWQSDNLVYLEGADYTMALSRKGEKPDFSRIKFKHIPKTGWMTAQQDYSGIH